MLAALLVAVGCELPHTSAGWFAATSNVIGWLDRGASPERAARLDLSPVGLDLVESKDARAEGIAGGYSTGSVTVFQRDISTLRFIVLSWEDAEAMWTDIGVGAFFMETPMDRIVDSRYCHGERCFYAYFHGSRSYAWLVAQGPSALDFLSQTMMFLASAELPANEP